MGIFHLFSFHVHIDYLNRFDTLSYTFDYVTFWTAWVRLVIIAIIDIYIFVRYCAVLLCLPLPIKFIKPTVIAGYSQCSVHSVRYKSFYWIPARHWKTVTNLCRLSINAILDIRFDAIGFSSDSKDTKSHSAFSH